MANELTLQIKSTFASVHSANEDVSRWLGERRAHPDVLYFANLAIEELVTNFIKYVYYDTNEHIIEINLSFSDGVLVLTVTDDGHPFNPLALPDPDTSLPAEELPIVGVGLSPVWRVCDGMEYVREGGKNKLTLRKAPHG